MRRIGTLIEVCLPTTHGVPPRRFFTPLCVVSQRCRPGTAPLSTGTGDLRHPRRPTQSTLPTTTHPRQTQPLHRPLLPRPIRTKPTQLRNTVAARGCYQLVKTRPPPGHQLCGTMLKDRQAPGDEVHRRLTVDNGRNNMEDTSGVRILPGALSYRQGDLQKLLACGRQR